MEHNVLNYFVTIAGEKSISKAAEKLYIAQPSLSQAIHKLEKDLGSRLLIRGAKGISLTAAGEVFLEYAQKVMMLETEMRTKIERAVLEPSGEITIAAGVAPAAIAQMFCEFQKTYKYTTVRFVGMEHIASNEMPDLVVTANILPENKWKGQALLDEELLVAVSTKHKLSGRESIRLEELAEEKFIYSTNRETDVLITNMCSTVGFKPNVILECNGVTTVTALVASGLGITMMPSSWKKCCSDQIVLIPICEPRCYRRIRLYKSFRSNHAAEIFSQYIQTHIKNGIIQAM